MKNVIWNEHDCKHNMEHDRPKALLMILHLVTSSAHDVHHYVDLSRLVPETWGWCRLQIAIQHWANDGGPSNKTRIDAIFEIQIQWTANTTIPHDTPNEIPYWSQSDRQTIYDLQSNHVINKSFHKGPKGIFYTCSAKSKFTPTWTPPQSNRKGHTTPLIRIQEYANNLDVLPLRNTYPD